MTPVWALTVCSIPQATSIASRFRQVYGQLGEPSPIDSNLRGLRVQGIVSLDPVLSRSIQFICGFCSVSFSASFVHEIDSTETIPQMRTESSSIMVHCMNKWKHSWLLVSAKVGLFRFSTKEVRPHLALNRLNPQIKATQPTSSPSDLSTHFPPRTKNQGSWNSSQSISPNAACSLPNPPAVFLAPRYLCKNPLQLNLNHFPMRRVYLNSKELWTWTWNYSQRRGIRNRIRMRERLCRPRVVPSSSGFGIQLRERRFRLMRGLGIREGFFGWDQPDSLANALF